MTSENEYIPFGENEYNFREKLNIYTGATIGALAPIIAARYLLFNSAVNPNLTTEVLSWAGAITLNFLPLAFGHAPLPLYGLMIGGMTGSMCAESLAKKRLNEPRTDKGLAELINPERIDSI